MRKPNYDLKPQIHVAYDENPSQGYSNIINQIKKKIDILNKSKIIVCLECYPGVIDSELLPAFKKYLVPDLCIESSTANLSSDDIDKLISRDLTDDRVRGFMNNYNISEFFDANIITHLRNEIETLSKGIVFIYGTGATLIAQADILIYADLARWEIQLRYRREEIANWYACNFDEDILRMYKRGFFIDWRVADRHKQTLFNEIDFLLDTNIIGSPKMISGDALRAGLSQTVSQPFRVVPYFDSGPWGGQWMKEVCQLDKSSPNYAWCFDGVPEENSLLLNYKDILIEIPSLNVVFYQPLKLLGEKVYSRFGKEFPIRFDFLDTMQGGNLSLQVHPMTEYIQEQFGMHYTQDESYYILDAEDDAVVYLGTKEGIDKKKMLSDLKDAQEGKISSFPAEKYINIIPAKKHDHFLIPAGTIHCSGKNAMVLEISATPYIFTFKLWDWGRLGMDGKPRPIHIKHGEKVINWSFDTASIKEKHVNCIVEQSFGDGWREESTGLHDREFIETRRHWFTKEVLHNTNGNLNVLNLVHGEEAIVKSPSKAFLPFIVHYAETFIIPACVGEYTITPYGCSKHSECATIKAYVRN